MKLSTIVLFSIALPASGFSMLRRYDFPRFSSYLKELDEVFERDWPTSFFEKQMDRLDEEMKEMKSQMKPLSEMDKGLAFVRKSPGYEVIEDPDNFKVNIDVPGFKLDEIDVTLKNGGRVLSVSGSQEKKEEAEGRTSSMSSKFEQNFSIDPSVEIDKLTANLSDEGKLVITAPRHPQLPENRKIPVTQLQLEEAKDQ